jgi:hypothetical protein
MAATASGDSAPPDAPRDTSSVAETPLLFHPDVDLACPGGQDCWQELINSHGHPHRVVLFSHSPELSRRPAELAAVWVFERRGNESRIGQKGRSGDGEGTAWRWE